MRPGLLAANHALAQNAVSIINGLDGFLARHTGDVDDNGDNVANKYIINNEGVIANNLHFEGGPQGYTPTQCATTEGQSLLILGYYYAWKGTGNPAYLQKAEYYFQAYVNYFYGGQPVPSTPQVYRSNWILNGKNPFGVYGPPNPLDDQSPGFYAQPVLFNNGVGVIPAGGPTYGDQLVKVYEVYTGKNAYNSVRAGPASGGTSLPFSYYMATNGAWDSNNDAVSPAPSPTPAVGTVVLQNTTFNGVANVSYVIPAGVMVSRNTPFDVWPTWRSVTVDEYGNAIDAEQWFTEAALLLYNATGNSYYNQVYQSALQTCLEASVVDDVTYYFRQEVGADPTDYGISYWWSYTPTTSVATVTRDVNGYIQATKTAESSGTSVGTVALEQIAVFNQIAPSSYMQVNSAMTSPTARLDFLTLIKSAVDASTGTQYRYSAPPGVNGVPAPMNVNFNQMLTVDRSDGTPIIMFDGNNFSAYGNGTGSSQYATFSIGGTSYADYIGIADVPDNNSGVVAGFWHVPGGTAPLESLTYKTISGTMYIKVADALGVNYWYQLPQANDWTTISLSWNLFTLAPYQSGNPSPTPTPNNALTQVIFETSNSAASIAVYCWGQVPTYYSPNYEWSTQWYMHANDVNAFTWSVGDVTIQNSGTAALKYTPGVVPFSNQYSPSLRRNEFWRGTPYSGYQYPVNWVDASLPSYYANVIQFWYDAQQAYNTKIGVLGPFAPVYVWPRYDDLGEGTVGTFSWGSDQPYPWGGYEARAFWSACHLWAELVRKGQTVDPKLVTVCQNFASFLHTFQQNNGGLTPTDFPSNAPPFNNGYSPDPTQSNPTNVGHMTGLFLAGCVEMLNAGDTSGYPKQVMRNLLQQLYSTYVVAQGSDADMTGSFSSWANGHYFYGFWAGEIFRGLGLYLEWLAAGNTL